VETQQPVRQCPQIGRQIRVSGGGIGPDRIAAMRWRDDGAEDRGLRVGVDKGHIGVPVVGATAAV